MTVAFAFASASYLGRDLKIDEVPRLQALFDANPEYSLIINGRPFRGDEAQAEFDEQPPSHLSFGSRHFLGVFCASGELVGVAIIVADMNVAQVWHTGLFLMATHLHGSGAASEVYDALEAAMEHAGARWLRLGVVAGNGRAERFWAGKGYREVRVRRDVDTGGQQNDVRVLGPVNAMGGLAPVSRRRSGKARVRPCACGTQRARNAARPPARHRPAG